MSLALTPLNSQVKIYVVDELFVGDEYTTHVWVAKRVSKALNNQTRTQEGLQFLKKLERYAKNGFGLFERSGPVRHEWDGVWRVGLHASLFRLIGFYVGPKKKMFIAIDEFTKSGTKLSASQRERIDLVAKIKRDNLWRKAGDESRN